MNKYLLIFLTLASTSAFPALNKWVDEHGQVHYSDTPPPPDAKTTVLRTPGAASTSAEDSSTSSAPAAPKSMAEREADLRKAQQTKKDADEKTAKQQADAEAKKTYCASLQQNLRALEEGIRMVELDAQGNRVVLEDEQRQQRIAKTQQDISTNCK